MARMLLLVAALAVLAGTSSAIDLLNTTGYRVDGYTYFSNIGGYINMTIDLCDIKAAVDAGNIDEAWNIFNNGKNSYTTNAQTALRKYATWTNSTNLYEQTYDMLIAYHGPSTTWLYDKVKAAYESGNGALLYNLLLITTQFKYTLHELDAAWNRTTTSNAFTNPVTGAAHAVDEGWSMFGAGHPNQCETPRSRMIQVAKELNVPSFGFSSNVLHATYQFGDMQYAATLGNTTEGVKLITDARAKLHVQYALYHAQGIVREAYASELYTNCRLTQWANDAKYTSHAYWFALAPYLKLRGVDSDTIAAVEASLTRSTLSYRQVRSRVNAALDAIKIGAARIGTPKYSDINKAASCRSSAAPRV